jgi:hypothetical protein
MNKLNIWYLIIVGLLVGLSGCIKSTGSFNQEDPSLVSFEGIQFKAKRYSVYVDRDFQIPQSDLNGAPPYKFLVDQGVGAIDLELGIYHAPRVLGFAVILVQDKDGRSGYVSIEVVDDLKVKVADFSMVTGTSYLLQITGGKYPYNFVIASGDVTVDELGVVTAGSNEGPAVVRVVDSVGNTQTVNIKVVKNLIIQPAEFAVTVSGTQTLVTIGGVGLAQLTLKSGVGSVGNNPGLFSAGLTTGTSVVAATDEMGNVGYGYGRVFGTLQISPSVVKIPKGESYNHFEALGGVPPFTYSIQGTGTIEATTGQYTAPAGTSTDTITVTDALGHTSQAVVTVTNSTRFLSRNAIVQVGDTLDFLTLIDGGVSPFTFAVAPGQGVFVGSVYTPPATLGNYTITITDNGGATTQAIILVYPSFTIIPTQLNIAVETRDFFSAQGGVPPYTFQVLSGLGSINAQTGAYDSGAQVGTAVVKVTDAQNHTAQATVQIKNRLVLSSNVISIEGGGTVNFTATGGVAPYAFSIVSGSGTLTANGADKADLVAGLNAGIVQVEAKDAIGNRISNYIQVLAKLSPIPPTLSIKVNQQYFFGAQGGLGPYQFQLISGSGSITTDGFYKASNKASTDKIRVTDSSARTAEAMILVYENMQMLPQSKTLLVGQSLTMTVTGGVLPITFSISSGQGSINQQGLFTAGTIAGNVVIHAADAQGNFADSVIVVNPTLEIIPNALSIKTNKSYNFAAAGGVPPYKYAVLSGAGGSINAATGEYLAPNSAGNYQVEVQDADSNVTYATVSVSNSGNGNGPVSGPPDHVIKVAGDNQTGTVNTVLPNSLQVQVVDSNGVTVPSTDLKVTVTSGSGTSGQMVITTGANGIASVPYFLGTTSGTDTIRIESNGTAFPGSPALIDFTATATPGTSSTSTSTILAVPSSGTPADGVATSTITATIKDIYGNIIPNATVTLVSSGSGHTLTPSSPTTNASGQVTATLASTVAENKTISFAAPAALASLNTVVGFGTTVTPDATTSTITGTTNIVADGVATATVTINLKSATNVAASGFVPTFSATDTGGTNTYGACSLSDSSGNSTCTLTSTKAETKILSIITPVNKVGASSAFVNGTANKLVFIQAPVTAAVNVALSPQPIVELQDVYNNRVTSGAEATASVSLSIVSGVGAMAGTASMSATAGRADFLGQGINFARAGAKVIRATSGALSVDSSSFSITSIPAQLGWSGNTSLQRGVCGSLTVSTYDSSNDLTNVTADLTITLGGAGTGGFYSDVDCTSPIASKVLTSGANNIAIYYKNNTTGTPTLTADAPSLTQGIYNLTVIPGAPTKLVWSGSMFTSFGTCSAALTVRVQDLADQDTTVSANTVITFGGQGSGQFYASADCSDPTSTATILSGNGSVSFYFKDGLGEVLLFTANSSGMTQGTYSFVSRYPILFLSGTGGSTLDGVAITSCAGGSTCNSTNPFNPYQVTTTTETTPTVISSYYSITMANAAYISANGTIDSSSGPNIGKLIVNVTENWTLCATCVITMDNKGYPMNIGPGKGAGGDGGSYGGKGGEGTGAGVSGTEYGDFIQPSDLGSGGGVGNNGRGGGHIALNVNGTLHLDGLISANGQNGLDACCYSGGAGGSGGSIHLTVGTISGASGLIRSSGGSGVPNSNYVAGGGGGGGRIAIHYANDSYTSSITNLSKEAYGNKRTDNSAASYAGAGTIFYKHLGVDAVGHLIVKNNPTFTLTYTTTNPPQTELLSDILTANLDSLTVASNTVVVVRSGTLNLPTAGVLDFPLFLDGGTLANMPGSDLTIAPTGKLYTPGSGILNFTNLTVNGKIYQWNTNAGTLTYALRLNIANNLNLGAGGLIDASGRGYSSGGSGYGSAAGRGGGHGGAGAHATTGTGGVAHDSIINPADLGGAGWQTDAQGGGLIDLAVGNTLTINGIIQANGISSTNGGAGGSIKITTSDLAGTTGVIRANGGAGSGAGGGGRIAVYYATISYNGGVDAITKEAFGGDGSGNTGDGAAGTIFYKNLSTDTNGHIIVKNNGAFTTSPQFQSNSATDLISEALTTTFDSISVAANTIVKVSSGTFNLPTPGMLNFQLALSGGALGNMPGNNLTISTAGTLWLSGFGVQTFNDLDVDGNIFQLNGNTTTPIYKINLNITNNLTIGTNGVINVSGKGYNGGGPGYGGSCHGAGGHGGIGGYDSAIPGATFDSLMNPVDLGGSGNSCNGGTPAGGGAVIINVSGTFTHDGSILANGVGDSGAQQCGAGGSINITTNALAGATGSLKANGGVCGYGNGGGGRIALSYNSNAFVGGIDGLAKEAYGGTSGVGTLVGGAGTIFYKHVGVDSVGHVLIKNFPSFAPGYSAYKMPSTELPTDALFVTFNSFTVDANALPEVKSGTFNLPTAGVLDFPLALNGGTLGNLPSNNLIVTFNGTLWLSGTGTQTFNDLTVAGKIYQWNFNGTTASYKLNFNIANNLTISSTGVIDVTGKGYLGGGPGYGAYCHTGGTHGGAGGNSNSAAVGSPYDSVLNPTDLGGAGQACNSSGGGGGAVIISVGNTLTLDGALLANGANVGFSGTDQTTAQHCGAGGTINVSANTLAGANGIVRANGGSCNYGNGGGGRIALYFNNNSLTGGIVGLTKEAYSGTTGAGTLIGGAGTIFYQHVGVDSVGHLIIKNNPSYNFGYLSYKAPTTELTAEALVSTYDSFTVGANSYIELKGGTLNLPTAGILDFPLILNGGTLGNIPGNNLTVATTGILFLTGIGTHTFNDLTINGKLYQWHANGATALYKINLNIINNLTIGSTGVIDVTGRGYYGGGPGYGGYCHAGGGHGGPGGYNAATPGAVHDSITNPTDLGGGGNSCNLGGAGGGAVLINVANTLNLSGLIVANGSNVELVNSVDTSATHCGAGGTINISTNTLAGTGGVLRANGGASCGWGNGGGGRIAVYYTTDAIPGSITTLTKEVYGGSTGSGTILGGIGTIYTSPKLNLNFTTGVLPGNVNLSRLSAGTHYNAAGVLVTAALHQPRFDFSPSDGTALGLLLEPQRTNELLYSEDLSQAFWTKQDLTLSLASLAPDASSVPYKLEETTANGFHAIATTLSLASGQDYTVSFYAKAVDRDWLAVNSINLAGTTADSYLNLATGTTGTVQHASVKAQTITNGWYRVTVSFNAGSGVTTPTIAIGTATGDNTKVFAGTTGFGLYLWGLQVEAGNYGSSYIATNGIAVTRSADVATITDLSWFVGGVNSFGTFLIDAQIPSVEYNMPFMQLDNGSSASSHRIGIHPSSYASHYLMKESSTDYIDVTDGTWASGDRKKVCAAFKTGGAALSTAGATATKSTPSTMANSGLATLRIGADHIGTSFSGHILTLKYWNDTFTDEACKQISQ